MVPVLKVDGKFIPNPMVVTDKWVEGGQIVYGQFKTGDEFKAGKDLLKSGQVDLTPLDEAVEKMITSLLMTMPGCLEKTVQSVRKHKLEHWDRNKETNRAWLALNMMNEANAGFRAFNEGPKSNREVDFVDLRTKLAQGAKWGPELIESVLPKKA